MHIAFRADASLQIGTGHVMRCLTLAEALRNQGFECSFICRNHQGNLSELIKRRGFELHLLKKDVPADQNTYSEGDSALAHGDWLGTSWQHDAEQTLKVLAGKKTDWLIVDNYALDARWESWVSKQVKKVMVIDDIADRRHECNLLLDQNLGRKAEDYNELVPETCTRLIGPYYALLRPEFAELRKRSLERRRTPELKRILITLGGVDRDNVTGQILHALAQSQLPRETEVDIVMGASAPGLDAIRQQVAKLPFKATVSVNVTDMAERMCMADLCIGAAGSTSWERCCLGLPAIQLVLAENQRLVNQALIDRGAALGLDLWGDKLGMLDLLLEQIWLDISKMNSNAAGVTDGLGCTRVVKQLVGLE